MITEKQLELRRRNIGGSDAWSLVYNPRRLYLDKTGQLEPWEGNEATDLGKRLEPALIAWARQQIGQKLVCNQRRVYLGHRPARIACNLDALVLNYGEPVEAKTSGLLTGTADGWGDDGSDQVPDSVLLQTQLQMLCTGGERAWVPTILPRRGLAMFVVPASRELQEYLVQRAIWFWGCVERREEPSEGTLDYEILVRRIRTPEKVATVDPDVIFHYETARLARLEAEKREKEMKAALLEAMGDAEAADGGDIEASYFATNRKVVDVDKLKTAGVYDLYTRLATSRTLRVKAKEGEPHGKATDQHLTREIGGQCPVPALGPEGASAPVGLGVEASA